MKKSSTAPKKKTLALIAHDGKKDILVGFVRSHSKLLKAFNLIGTGNTSRLVESQGLKISKRLSGPLGGDAQIAAEVAEGRCQAVIFLRDPLGMHPHDPDISMLMRICDVHDVPLATNPASASLILQSF